MGLDCWDPVPGQMRLPYGEVDDASPEGEGRLSLGSNGEGLPVEGEGRKTGQGDQGVAGTP